MRQRLRELCGGGQEPVGLSGWGRLMFHEKQTKGSVQSWKGTFGFGVQSMGTELSVLHVNILTHIFHLPFFQLPNDRDDRERRISETLHVF